MIGRWLFAGILTFVSALYPAYAQVPNFSGMGVPNTLSAPCAVFGTSAGTCAQGGVITAGGPTGSATTAPIITYNAAGQLTTVTSATITPAVSSITGFGTGVATALGINIGSAGAPVTNGGALGTPSSGVATNLTGTASSLTAGNVTTNANLTGPITSSGNATAIASQTGTGTKFVVDTSPTIVTPTISTITSAAATPLTLTAPAGAGQYVAFLVGTVYPVVANAAAVNAQLDNTIVLGNTGQAWKELFTRTAIIGATNPTLASGELAGDKITPSGSAPGAGSAKMAWVAGTNSGSCKLISYAGTSATPVTIIDNVGAGC